MSGVPMHHVFRVTSKGWTHCQSMQAGTWQAREVPDWPRLAQAAFVVLDLDEVFTDVWHFEGRPEHAAALIEKRARTQGLVEGETHVVVHRLLPRPGGFQVFFSALPLPWWQHCAQWARQQRDHCLVMLAAGLLCDGVEVDRGRMLSSQRRLMLFAQTEEGMVFGSTLALGAQVQAGVDAARLLTDSHGPLLARLGAGAVGWGALWSADPGQNETARQALRVAMQGEPVALNAVTLSLNGDTVRCALPGLAAAAVGRHAVNGLKEHLAWQAQRWVVPLAGATAALGLALALVGVLMGRQADRQQADALRQRQELAVLQERIQAVATVELPAGLLDMAAFARSLDAGQRHDPVAFLSLLQASTSPDIVVRRLHLQTASASREQSLRLDATASRADAIPRWVRAMTSAGWRLKSLEPAEPVPGAFSYELTAAHSGSGKTTP